MKPMKECENCCGEGKIESFEDCFSHAGGHYTIDRVEACEACNGAGVIEHDDDCDCDECVAIFDAKHAGHEDQYECAKGNCTVTT